MRVVGRWRLRGDGSERGNRRDSGRAGRPTLSRRNTESNRRGIALRSGSDRSTVGAFQLGQSARSSVPPYVSRTALLAGSLRSPNEHLALSSSSEPRRAPSSSRPTTRASEWTVDGPHFPGEAVYSIAYDQRARPHARCSSACTATTGAATIRAERRLRRSWTGPERQAIRFPESSGLSLAQVWQIMPGRAGGARRRVVRRRAGGALPLGRRRRELGAGRRGCSSTSIGRGGCRAAAGSVCTPSCSTRRTATGWRSPSRRRASIAPTTAARPGGRATTACAPCSCPTSIPEFGQCVHKVTHHPSRPERLFLQNHWGLYRSDDWGDSLAGHRQRRPVGLRLRRSSRTRTIPTPSTSSRSSRTSSASSRRRKLRVYRTQDAGASWGALDDGLPQEHAFESVLRDGLAVDTHDPRGRVLRHAQRQAVRLERRRRALEDARRRAAADLLREDRRRRRVLTRARLAHGRLRRPPARAHAVCARHWAPCSSTRRAPRCATRSARSAARWPALVDRVLTEQGELRRHVNIFVGDESIAFLDGLSTRDRRGDDDHDRPRRERRLADLAGDLPRQRTIRPRACHVIQEAKPLIEWSEAVVEYVGFVAQFVAAGAIGFRYAAVRDRLRATRNVGATGDGRFYAYACARAARIALLGAIVSAILFATRLPANAARAHTTVIGLITHDRIAGAQTLLSDRRRARAARGGRARVVGLAARRDRHPPRPALRNPVGPVDATRQPGAPARRRAVDRHAVRARRRRPRAAAARRTVARASRHHRVRHGERLLAARAHLRRPRRALRTRSRRIAISIRSRRSSRRRTAGRCS